MIRSRQCLSGEKKQKGILIIHQPEIQNNMSRAPEKKFLIHLASSLYISLWNNIRSLKIFTRCAGPNQGAGIGRRIQPNAILLADIFTRFIFYIYKAS